MSNEATIRLIRAYIEMAAAPTRFFSGMFQSPRANFYNSREVELDIRRGGEPVSIAVEDLSVGYRKNSTDIYTNKKFIAPIHKESIALNSFDLNKRMPGDNPFQDPNFRANIVRQVFLGMREQEDKIRRAIELQASQVMLTGTATLKNADGTTIYSIDYSPKSTHFPNSGTAWGSATGLQMMADIQALGDLIRADGLTTPNQLIFGDTAWTTFINTAGIQAVFDKRRIDLGTIAPQMRGEGAVFQGQIFIGNYGYDVWTYSGRYDDVASGASTPYMDPVKVIVRAAGARLDATFGGIPNIGRDLGLRPVLIPELPRRVANTEGGMDMFTNIWITDDGEQLLAGVGARPLMIPTQIDSFGCLDTQL